MIAAGARVINMSLGGDGMSRVLREALQDAADRGIVIVISAGNEGDTALGGRPDGFALDAFENVTGGTLIIAGSVGTATDPHAITIMAICVS